MKSHLRYLKCNKSLQLNYVVVWQLQEILFQKTSVLPGVKVNKRNYLFLKVLVIERAEKILHIENLNLHATIKNRISEEESL